ncbi:unnamed protein product [Anisakis simplex]|uniref:BPI2 domain-containing protein n=1 Tax=Anisakis simplex TaxID=6269 RepID=A0A0M3J446_ANISI|nr:unnamed protein product [Anisakis simplex]
MNLMQVQINDAIRQQIPSVLCSSIQKFIEDASPALFKRLARADLSDQFKTPGPIGIPAVERLVHRFTKGLYIDNRNIADPTITYDFFETQQSGEIRYDDNPRRTPFFPSPMRTTNDSDRMLYFYGSEYLFNSLLFHAYEGNRLMLEIDESSLPPTYKPLLWTSCAKPTGGNFLATFCLGKLIPAIAEKFPNATSSFVLIPHELPVFQLIDGIGTIDLKTRVLTYINEGRRRRQILVSSTDVVADLRLLIDDHNFAADFKLHKLAVGLHRSAVDGISSEEISQMAPLAKTFLGPQLSKALRKGLPFPLQVSLQIFNSLSLFNHVPMSYFRYMLLS